MSAFSEFLNPKRYTLNPQSVLSIIIPTYNEEKFLPRVLESIKRQSYRDYEIIVADADSRDWTRKIAHNFGAKVVEGGMPGPGRNAGAVVARGNIFLFFDADIVLDDANFLRDCLAEFHRRKLDLATCSVAPLSEKTVDKIFHKIFNIYMRAIMPISPHAPGFCIMAKRSVHEKIGGFDAGVIFAEDKDYVTRAVTSGARFRVLNSRKISVSVRRFDRDGRWNIAKRYLLAEAHHILRGSVRKELFPYEFGKYDDVGVKPMASSRRKMIKESLSRTFGANRAYGAGRRSGHMLRNIILNSKAADLWRKLK